MSIGVNHNINGANHVKWSKSQYTLPVIKIQSFSELCFIKMIKTFTNTLFLGYGYICARVGTWSFLHHPLDQVWAF